MNSKDYFRSLALHDLGFPADKEVLELDVYITEKLSNLNQYTSDLYPKNIFYGKSNHNLIFYFNTKRMYIYVYDTSFTNNLISEFNLKITDIELILLKYINNSYPMQSGSIEIEL